MSWRLGRLLAIIVAGLSLGACILSDHDISTELKPEFPIKPGSFVNKEGTVVDVSRGNNEYRLYNRKTKDVSYARLYKIPEYSDYVFQIYEHKKGKKIYYFFMKVTEKGFDFYDIENTPSVMPEHI